MSTSKKKKNHKFVSGYRKPKSFNSPPLCGPATPRYLLVSSELFPASCSCKFRQSRIGIGECDSHKLWLRFTGSHGFGLTDEFACGFNVLEELHRGLHVDSGLVGIIEA